jgi:hypothetical protein
MALRMGKSRANELHVAVRYVAVELLHCCHFCQANYLGLSIFSYSKSSLRPLNLLPGINENHPSTDTRGHGYG